MDSTVGNQKQNRGYTIEFTRFCAHVDTRQLRCNETRLWACNATTGDLDVGDRFLVIGEDDVPLAS